MELIGTLRFFFFGGGMPYTMYATCMKTSFEWQLFNRDFFGFLFKVSRELLKKFISLRMVQKMFASDVQRGLEKAFKKKEMLNFFNAKRVLCLSVAFECMRGGASTAVQARRCNDTASSAPVSSMYTGRNRPVFSCWEVRGRN